MEWFAITMILFVLNGGLLYGVGRLCEAAILGTPDRHLLWRGVLLTSLLAPLMGAWFQPLNLTEASGSFHLEAAAGTLAAKLTPWVSASALAAAVIAAGAMVRLTVLAGAYRRLGRFCRSSKPAALPAQFDPAALHGAIDFELRRSRDVDGPVTFGWRRPVVLAPPAFFDFEPGVQRSILLHELEHIRRGDWLRQLVEELLLAILWFHPFLHLTVRKVRFYRECMVDRRVIAMGTAKDEYLRSLILAAGGRSSKAATAAALFGGSELRNRIESLLKEATMSFRPSATHSGLIVSVLAFGAMASNAFFPLTPLGATGIQSAEELKIEELDENPKPISQTIPKYTEEAIEAGIEGAVLLNCLIDVDGLVKDCEVKRGLGHGLEESAMRDITENWRFEPGRKDGSPVSVRATIEITFNLRKDSAQ
jgi:TonB family protein